MTSSIIIILLLLQFLGFSQENLKPKETIAFSNVECLLLINYSHGLSSGINYYNKYIIKRRVNDFRIEATSSNKKIHPWAVPLTKNEKKQMLKHPKMKAILILFFGMSIMSYNANESTYDFGSGQNQVNNWIMISDNVMGGVTKSNLEYTENAMILTGDISLKNFGGFASVKSTFGKYDISQFKGVKIKFKATNQKFAFTLEDKNK